MPGRGTVRLGACLGLTMALLGGAATDASAQGEGVFVDPDSPAGKEYALPFEAARRDAAGPEGRAGSGSPGQNASAPAFGAGISPRSDKPVRRREVQPAGRNDTADDRDEATSGMAGAAPSGLAAAAVESGDDISPTLLTALIGLGVLLVGTLIGLGVRLARKHNHAS